MAQPYDEIPDRRAIVRRRTLDAALARLVEDLPDGGVEVRFRASGMRELAWHLFSWGDQVEIVAPDRLKAMMGEALQAAQAALDRSR